MTIYMWIATVAWLAMMVGFSVRRTHPLLHQRCMQYCIASDFLLVLFLEVTRGAIEKATSFTMTMPQQIHIGLSAVALLLYIPMIILGQQLAKDRTALCARRRHAKLGVATFTFRTLGFAFMFSMWR